jgi:crossover junction endodeoxyribonuclease RuvC
LAGLTIDGNIRAMGVSAKQFAEMQDRTAGRKGRPKATPSAPTKPTAHQIIIGIDPSLRGTGYGVIRLASPHPETLAEGTIKCPPTWEHSRCLLHIANELRAVVNKTRPTVAAVEGIFFAQNLKTAIIMGQARGAALVPLAEARLEIYEIATRKVKQAIVGYGGAQKSAVAKMVQRMLNLPAPPAPDAADALALALALTHANDLSRATLKPPKKI